MKAKPKRIALIGLPILQSINSLNNAAIAQHAEESGRWHFIYSAEATVGAFRYLRRLDCDGAIVRIISPAMRREALRIRFPMVNLSAWLENPGVPTVRTDFYAMGRLAAEHLLAKGFRRFGCVQTPGGWFMRERLRAVEEVLKARGLTPAKFISRSGDPISPADRARFVAWVRTLKPPAALVLLDDLDAPTLMNACREAGWEIPYDLALASACTHSEVVDLCRPALTNAQEDHSRQGEIAVEWLEKLMAGQQLPGLVFNVPPLGLAERASSAIPAIEDRQAAHVLGYIREHACEAINMETVADQCGLSRATLDRHFSRALGMSPHDYLQQQRIERAKELLRARPALTIETVARQSGFQGRRRLNLVFRQLVGQSAKHWRSAMAGS